MPLFHLKKKKDVYADVCSIYCWPSTMFAYVIVFCLMPCGTPTWVSGPTGPAEHVLGNKWYFWCSYRCTQVIIWHMISQFLIGRLWFENTSVDPGRPCMLLLPLSPAILFSVQSVFTPTDIHMAPALVIVNCSEFFQMCTDTCTLHVGWAGEGVSTQTTAWTLIVNCIL